MKRALLLEDSRPCATVAMRELLTTGYLVERQASAAGARSACARYAFDLYIVDVSIPATNHGGLASGLDFAAWLLARQPDARIVLWSSNDHTREARLLGAVFVHKGDAEALRKAVI